MGLNLGIRRRLAPLMNNDLQKLKFINALLFSLPGTPIIYYGDEIGMGDNIHLNDRDGCRTPMQWNDSENAGFSDAPKDFLHVPVIDEGDFSYKKVNVNNQKKEKFSIFNYTKKLIKLRKNNEALRFGDYRFFESNHDSVMIFNRFTKDEEIVTIYNFSDLPIRVEFRHENYKHKKLKELFTGEELTFDSNDFVELNLDYYDFKWFKIN